MSKVNKRIVKRQSLKGFYNKFFDFLQVYRSINLSFKIISFAILKFYLRINKYQCIFYHTQNKMLKKFIKYQDNLIKEFKIFKNYLLLQNVDLYDNLLLIKKK